ncbi:MAG: hypothetical protein PVG78_06200 [Desulfobacterales bacterium]
MRNVIPIRFQDANKEVLARIVKAASKKFNCTMKIDFENGRRTAEFIGDDIYRPLIAEEVEEIFRR